jgi:hypothetical protein
MEEMASSSSSGDYSTIKEGTVEIIDGVITPSSNQKSKTTAATTATLDTAFADKSDTMILEQLKGLESTTESGRNTF